MAVIRLVREYPSINGFPVPPSELSLPPSRLNPERQQNYNNHHSCWTARRMGLCALTQTWRDLAKNQTILPKDTHTMLHQHYEPVSKLPTLEALMDEIDAAYQNQDPLRFGSASNPTYGLITPDKYRSLQVEYNELSS